MVGNPEKRNRNLYCQYHQDHGHTREDCRSLWDHLDQLVRKGKLKHLLHHSNGLGGQANRLRKTFLQDLPRELSMLSSLHQAEQDHARLG